MKSLLYQSALFKSFFQGGFECSTHHRFDGKRLDLTASTQHDQYAHADYKALSTLGIQTVRDGLRWHLIEKAPFQYDWSSFLPMLHASVETGTQVIWDLCHYGWPDDIDVWKPEFVKRFAHFSAAVAKLIRDETDEIPFYAPINEISFWSWAGGDVAYFNPIMRGRGFELKHQLIRATIAAIESIRQIDPRARFVQAEPLIHVASINELDALAAKNHHESQYQTWDMLTGLHWPGLGGEPHYLDIIGVNYYPYNQWYVNGPKILLGHPQHLSFEKMLADVYSRYQRPLFIAETGTEGVERLAWFSYIFDEVGKAITQGIPIEGVCLYPITHYPGWDDDRHCETGLLSAVDPLSRSRSVYTPLVTEIAQRRFAKL